MVRVLRGGGGRVGLDARRKPLIGPAKHAVSQAHDTQEAWFACSAVAAAALGLTRADGHSFALRAQNISAVRIIDAFLADALRPLPCSSRVETQNATGCQLCTSYAPATGIHRRSACTAAALVQSGASSNAKGFAVHKFE